MLALADKQCEQAVIGAIINDAQVYYDVADLLTPEVFTSPKYRTIYEAIVCMMNSGQSLDVITLYTYLTEHPVKEVEVEAWELTEISSSVASTVTANNHAAVIRDLWQRRNTLLLLHQLSDDAADRSKPIGFSIEETAERLQSVMDNTIMAISTASEALTDLDIMIKNQLQGEAAGTPTGIRCIDDRGGLRPQSLTIVAGYPGQGKSSIALQMSINGAVEGSPSAFYTLEMSNAELMGRAVAADGGVNVSSLLNKPESLSETDWQRYRNSVSRLKGLPIYFDEKATASVENIIQSARTLVRKYHIKGIFVDYLQILANNRKNSKGDEAFLGDTVRAFKNLAKQENIFVVLLSQLARNHDSKEPSPDYLRGSGQIFEGCDNCYLIFRPEVTGSRYTGINSNVDPHGTAQIQVAKCRNGAVGAKYILGFSPEITKFYELDGKPPQISATAAYQKGENEPY